MNAFDSSLQPMPGDRPWLKSYPEGVPSEIQPLKHASLGELFEDVVSRNGHKPAFTCMGKTLSFGDIDVMSRQVAAWLQQKGLKHGDRVAIMFPNILQFPVVALAVLRAGFVAVNVNPLYTPRELNYQLKDAGAKLLFTLENFAATVQQSLPGTGVETVVVATMGDLLGLKGHLVNFVVRKVKKLVPLWTLPGHVPFKSLMAEAQTMRFRAENVSAADVAFLQYTGGTTGVAKGAVLTHGNILANAEQTSVWLSVLYRRAGKPEDFTFICPLPLYHIFALTVNLVMGMKEVARNVLIPNPRDIPAFVKVLRSEKIHVFPGLNTLFNALVNNEEFKKLDFSKLILSLAGGMACQRPVAERWQAVTGCPISEGYGLSETSPIATVNRLDAGSFTGTIGLPLPSTDIQIQDDDGRQVPLGVVGEICIRGPQVMSGYWNKPEETAKVMTPDGFFRSGDMGVMDENGYIRIVDRKKDMVIVSGFNVYPNEVEEVVASHPGVMEAAVIGVPDEHSGEAVKLFVVRKNPDLTAAEIKEYCASRLTNYKRPRHIEFRDSLPKSNVGKILRKELRT
ncbi:long-chain-fatty-acid--CoA ligase [Rhizobium sp. G21]|uniref:long-chain-fatty-acid--CoA ligase n=1 Tax=Rhizobium sp. G21 TaxID=2758439 RepID=UPI001FEE95B9|nr:long-chain-fatty-acid--CoA ligase [Rhizobium sp. G21]